MGFVDPSRQQPDEQLPGSGLQVDLQVKVCPACRLEALPWQSVCGDCQTPTVAPTDLPAEGFVLPEPAGEDGDDR